MSNVTNRHGFEYLMTISHRPIRPLGLVCLLTFLAPVTTFSRATLARATPRDQ
jgi:hypothetical protein